MPATLPLHDFWQLHAPHWQEDFGWLVPWHFGDWKREYQAALSSLAVWDISPRTTLVVAGKDRSTFLHNFCTNDIVRTGVGQGCEAFLTTAQAKILAWFHAFVEAETIYLDADPGRGPIMIQHLSRYHITEEVSFQDLSGQLAVLHWTGPRAQEKLARWLHVSSLPQQEHQHIMITCGDQALRVRQLRRLGQPGWDVVSPPGLARQLLEQVWDDNLCPLGYAAAEVLRIEAGWPVFGRDLDETNLPQEVDRDELAISFTKGCYLGQETVARIRAYGHVNRKLCGLRFNTADSLPSGTRLFAPQPSASATSPAADIGRITSSATSPRLGAAIALAWLRRGYWQPGTVVLAVSPSGSVTATVCALPFIA
ncbi:MAG: glycine cleavage T C-terminal barrel domain-containing protein [Gemmatales bacterium]|nr:glycine cleavage T C-terminal barrel domain-containing protein [Gemmatales bacterium]